MNQQPMTRDEALLVADEVADSQLGRRGVFGAVVKLAAEVRKQAAEIERLQAVDAEAQDAWQTEAMRLAHECTLKFSAMENDGESDGLPNWNAAKRKLREHLARGVVRV